MKQLLLLLTFCGLILNAQQERKSNVITDAGDAAKLLVAKQKLLGGEYISALNMYREVAIRNPKDASVKYYVGLCQFNLDKTSEAKETLLAALQLDNPKPETHLVLGRIYQLEGEFEKAVQSFTQFRDSGAGSEEEKGEGALLLSHSKNAIMYMKNPVNVKIENLGPNINSAYDDKNPCISADGSSLVFTTRRPATTNSPTDVEGDGKYFEDIYIAHTDSAGGFTRAEGVSKLINTAAHDACTSISPDGTQIFIYKNDASSRESRGGNIFVSKVVNDKWRKPVPLGKPINSSYWEGGACVSPDGKRYFFSSEREGGKGRSDIWMVEKLSKNEWGKPVNLDSVVNTPYDEAGMFLSPDGKTLFFCSNRPESMGSYDIFRTIYENGKWSAPENLGYPINSPAKEGQLTLSADARYAYLSSARAGGLGENDIYSVDLADFAILEKDFKNAGNGLCILKGTIREGNEGYGLKGVDIQVKNSEGQTFNTTTGDLGEYFYTLPQGNYSITVSRKGYETVKEEVQLKTAERGSSVTEKGYLLKKDK